MMIDNYTQTIECEISKEARKKQLLGVGFVFLAFVCLTVAATVNWWVAIGAGIFAVSGGIFLHLFNDTAKEYTYEFSTSCIVISKKDAVNRQHRILTLYYKDVVSFGILEGLLCDDDVVATDKCGSIGVYEINYVEDGVAKRLCLVPDDYMIALLSEAIANAQKANV